MRLPVFVQVSAILSFEALLSHMTCNRNYWWSTWLLCVGLFQAGIFFVLYEGPRWGQQIQLRAYKCVVGSLSDSYIFGFDVVVFFINPEVLFAFEVIRSMWGFHDRSLDMSTPKYLAQETTSRT